MRRSLRLLTAAALACVLLLALSLYLRSWGGLTLILLGAGAVAWYRTQVARREAAEQFFGDMGEETRVTGFQGGPASELSAQRPLSGTITGTPPES